MGACGAGKSASERMYACVRMCICPCSSHPYACIHTQCAHTHMHVHTHVCKDRECGKREAAQQSHSSRTWRTFRTRPPRRRRTWTHVSARAHTHTHTRTQRGQTVQHCLTCLCVRVCVFVCVCDNFVRVHVRAIMRAVNKQRESERESGGDTHVTHAGGPTGHARILARISVGMYVCLSLPCARALLSLPSSLQNACVHCMQWGGSSLGHMCTHAYACMHTHANEGGEKGAAQHTHLDAPSALEYVPAGQEVHSAAPASTDAGLSGPGACLSTPPRVMERMYACVRMCICPCSSRPYARIHAHSVHTHTCTHAHMDGQRCLENGCA